MKKLLLLSILLIIGCEEPVDVYGCTDSNAENYNSDANTDDGSCVYPDFAFTNPMGGDTWCIDSTYSIEWSGGNVNDIIGRLHFSDVNANAVELSIVTGIANSGSYEWVAEVGVIGIGEKRLYIENEQQTQYKHSAIFSILYCGATTDIDGNDYETIQIGEQLWMAENLKVAHYNNGNEIPTGFGNVDWGELSTGAYEVYDNSPNNSDIYGYLYNWYALDDNRGICPEDWHVPSDAEWKQLEMYLGMSQEEVDEIFDRGTDEGGKLKGLGTEYWEDPNTGATNESGFTALPGGSCWGDDCTNIGKKTFYWSATGTFGNATLRNLIYDNSMIGSVNQSMNSGLSVRCVAD